MRIFLSLLLLIFVVSCSKNKKVNKRLSGTWNVVSLKVTETSTNLSHYAEATGTLQFTAEGKQTTTGNYDFAIDYNLDGNAHQVVESGTYSISESNCTLTSSQNVETPARIVYINKEDLEFELETSNSRRLQMVLKKND